MDTKSPHGPPNPPNINEEDLPPPSYNDTIAVNPNINLNPPTDDKKQPSTAAPPIANTSPYTTAIHSQIANLTTTLSAVHVQKTLLTHAKDERVLSLLTPAIKSYLSAFAQSSLRRGTLVIIPSTAISDPTAVPCGFDFSDPKEYDRVIRFPSSQASPTSPSTSNINSENTTEDGDAAERETYYWNDAPMARRLASYLTPHSSTSSAKKAASELPPRPTPSQTEETGGPLEETPKKGFSFWKKKTAVAGSGYVSSPAKRDATAIPDEKEGKEEREEGGGGGGDKVVMEVKAEEVVFRTENEMGLFETERGWAVVLRLQVAFGR